MLLLVIINGSEEKEKFSVASLLSYQVMTLIATCCSLILFIYCSTLKWVDIHNIQSGRIKGDKVVTSGKTAVCRFVICKMLNVTFDKNVKNDVMTFYVWGGFRGIENSIKTLL